MPKLPIDKLLPGDRVAAPVLGAGGQILIAAGATLSLSQIELLKGRGLPAVAIQERGQGDVAPGTPAAAAHPLPAVPTAPSPADERRFGDVSNDPVMAALLQAVTRRRAQAQGR